MFSVFQQLDSVSLVFTLLAGTAVLAVVLGVVWDFISFHQQKEIKQETKSWVDTLTMSLFFVGLYLLIRFHLGVIALPDLPLFILKIVGLVLLIAGAIVNWWGRLALGKQWGDQIRIYEHHQFIHTGPYAFIRHPLYSSLIGMGIGSGLVYANLAAVLSTCMFFLPMMIYRAGQEEKSLMQHFPHYKEYQLRTGLFWPRLFSRPK